MPLPPFVTKRAGSFHLEIDAEELASTLAAEPLPAKTRGRVVGPYDLHVLNELRQRYRVRGPTAIPADYFIWGTGEAPHRGMTKLGGLPYLPASARWPEREGTAGDFYAQLNFADSEDLVPSLPGEVLLVFRFHDLEYTSWDEELYEFVWVDLREQELIAPEGARSSEADRNDPWPAMHGYRFRAFDDPSRLDRLLADASIDPELASASVTKIGGAATDRQSVREPEVPDDWRFLGQITGVWPSTGTPYPVIDRPAAVPPDPTGREYRALTTGPGDGITCLYLDSGGRVRVHFSGA